MSYLSKGERTNFLLGLGVYEVLDRWVNDPKNHLSNEEKKYFKTGATYIKKACISLINRLEEDYKNRLLSDSKNNYLAIVPRRTTTLQDESRVNTETLYNLSDFALIHCQINENCFGEANWKECKLYKILVELAVPVANFDMGKDKRCPYKL